MKYLPLPPFYTSGKRLNYSCLQEIITTSWSKHNFCTLEKTSLLGPANNNSTMYECTSFHLSIFCTLITCRVLFYLFRIITPLKFFQ